MMDNDYYTEMECKVPLEHGACPPDQAAFFVYSREYHTSDEIMRRIVEGVPNPTLGCYDMTGFHFVEQLGTDTPLFVYLILFLLLAFLLLLFFVS